MIVLDFPPATLSGHANGNRWSKSAVTKQYRAKAYDVASKAQYAIPDEGDIRIHMRFVPPTKAGDRVNFPNRMKPYIDGIADALGINDSRFLPSYEFCAPEKPGRVEITMGITRD